MRVHVSRHALKGSENQNNLQSPTRNSEKTCSNSLPEHKISRKDDDSYDKLIVIDKSQNEKEFVDTIKVEVQKQLSWTFYFDYIF